MERLVIRIGNEPAVPTEFDMDFVFDLDKGTFDGLQRIFNQLDAYEDTGLKPKEIERLKGEVFGLKVDKQELEQYRALGPVDRLAAYKETGLEPEEVLPKEYAGEIMRSMILSKEYQKLGPIDRLRELASADREGRCVVLPCKTGDAVWIIPERGARRAERWIVHRVYKRDAGRWCFDLKNMMLSQKRPNEFEMCRRSISSFGKTVFLTREAAEAALKGERK